ncbi:MAG TPA: xanthine dehydrogenase accessory protein XdhC [Ideonella sp.]|uniref:xanthine dehydrogenase accessory protein XdhC n=1 Tax=Ideonella sp. TaxID=1929293 RepID=UPI002E342B81|nr:xanthine dehydrogenase accessory protein XdhC [Ideonella sp.]HEX5685632.1 xanthine dehydrogenase accessory protein XdhC [Ideonella sp.]
MLDPDRNTAAQWLATRHPAMLVEVIEARGSVPREAGTRMLVSAHEVAGTIGGGHLEWQAIARARERLAANDTAPLDWAVALGPSLGQCCGGALTLRLSPLTQAAIADWPAPRPLFRLHLFGAGHVGRAMVQVLAGVPCEIVWVDERESEFPASPSPDHVQRVCVEPVEAEVANGRPGDFYLVLTHSHVLDLAITEAILRRGDFGWFGLIGSATKRARFEHRLRDRGIADDMLSRMVCPIGLPDIGGKQPGVIAVSVAAQILGIYP